MEWLLLLPILWRSTEGKVMHAARLTRSERLRRVLAVLQDGEEHSTRDLIAAAHVCAVNSIVAELRANGATIGCERRGDVWYYRLAVKRKRAA